MPFDPRKPANNSPNSSVEMHGQLTALNADIQTRTTVAAMNAAIVGMVAGSSANSNGMGTVGMAVSAPPTQAEVQSGADKLDDLINALHGLRPGDRAPPAESESGSTDGRHCANSPGNDPARRIPRSRWNADARGELLP